MHSCIPFIGKPLPQHRSDSCQIGDWLVPHGLTHEVSVLLRRRRHGRLVPPASFDTVGGGGAICKGVELQYIHQ